MSVDLSEFTSSEPVLCKLARRLDEMSDENRAKAVAALAEPSVKHNRIAKVLTDWGYPVSEDVVRKHRNSECCCG